MLAAAWCRAHNTALTCCTQAVGEPPFHLGASVFFALKDAVYAARKCVAVLVAAVLVSQSVETRKGHQTSADRAADSVRLGSVGRQ
jgi:xanthine dehydrogenase molybdopterin-binding subunit B